MAKACCDNCRFVDRGDRNDTYCRRRAPASWDMLSVAVPGGWWCGEYEPVARAEEAPPRLRGEKIVNFMADPERPGCVKVTTEGRAESHPWKVVNSLIPEIHKACREAADGETT